MTMQEYTVYQVTEPGSGAGIVPDVVIVKVEPSAETVFYRYGPMGDWSDAEDGEAVAGNVRIADAIKGSDSDAGPFSTLDQARFAALKLQMDSSFRVQIYDTMPLAWIAFTQILYIAALYTPGVMFIGSAYATVVQAAVVLSTVLNNGVYIKTATRVSTAVAIGNFVLAMLVWQSAYGTSNKISAAYRASVVSVVGFCIISTNQYLSMVATRPEARGYA